MGGGEAPYAETLVVLDVGGATVAEGVADVVALVAGALASGIGGGGEP